MAALKIRDLLARHYGACAIGASLFALTVFNVQAEDLNLNIGEQKLHVHGANLKRVAIADPSVLSVTMTNAKTMMITPKAAGATTISLWDAKSAEPQILHITVSPDVVLAKSGLATVKAYGVNAEAAGANVALDGSVGSLEEHTAALESMDKERKTPVDVSMGDFDSHVQIDIKIVEVSRQNAMRFGFLLGRSGGNHNGFGVVSGPGTISGYDDGAITSGSGFLPVASAFNAVFGNNGSGLLGSLSILESNGFAYTLAEPSLSALSGQTATFLAGGEFPVPVRAGQTGDGAISIRYKEYGVRLMLTPTILSNERIYLKVAPEVSELDFANAVSSGGVTVPSLKVRRTETSVQAGNGESFVISGMISRNTINNVEKVPGLGNIPILGAFFSSKRFEREDKELLMVVTPRLVRPISRDATLPELPGKAMKDYKPSFSEFFSATSGIPKATSTGMSR
ncbi:pilus assembly protein CpaC [Methylobacillus rhizosphaerae]|uniref:Pilus assembly protein CpaC n=1 Tax=Methylobacillus rhizosphaerae TaxID=551994 RepID=A0A238YLG0_9PROT|nr:type II and III secretion system protein family protein [Methylobacillus rhizosphaerae]SNR71464.1 pilus assembly protein CpaC [Methylobacillus rhizosphaerae]